ncbi:MAG: hypothetical protein J6D28_01905 [Bacilli bacterium]|nr:hypothetical protein [Bacilli bacterium]
MNSFQKNPFKVNSSTKIVGYSKQFDDKEKISNIKMTMSKLKFQKPVVNNQDDRVKPLGINEKVDILKNMNRYK